MALSKYTFKKTTRLFVVKTRWNITFCEHLVHQYFSADDSVLLIDSLDCAGYDDRKYFRAIELVSTGGLGGVSYSLVRRLFDILSKHSVSQIYISDIQWPLCNVIFTLFRRSHEIFIYSDGLLTLFSMTGAERLFSVMKSILKSCWLMLFRKSLYFPINSYHDARDNRSIRGYFLPSAFAGKIKDCLPFTYSVNFNNLFDYEISSGSVLLFLPSMQGAKLSSTDVDQWLSTLLLKFVDSSKVLYLKNHPFSSPQISRLTNLDAKQVVVETSMDLGDVLAFVRPSLILGFDSTALALCGYYCRQRIRVFSLIDDTFIFSLYERPYSDRFKYKLTTLMRMCHVLLL